MLNHYIILPSDELHYIKLKDLQVLKKYINVKVIYTQDYVFHSLSPIGIQFYDKEIIDISSIVDLKKGDALPISLKQLMLIDFKNTSSIHLIGNNKQLFFLLQILEILHATSIKIFWTRLGDFQVKRINNQQSEISIIEENFLNLNEIKIKNYIMQICKEEIKIPLKTIKKYNFSSNATLSQHNGNYEVVFSVQDKILLRSFISFQKQIVNTVDNINPIKRKIKKLIKNPKRFFKDFIIKKIR